MVANVLVKYGWDQMKSIEVALWNIKHQMVMREKNQTAIKILFKFGTSPKK